jgi:hypothetical protein
VTVYDLGVAVLATWYISYILTAQKGPFLILERLRNRFGGLLDCIYCIAPYVAAGIVLLMRNTSWGTPVVQVFAIAGGALMLRSYTGAGLHV